jgi:serine phosphatase RsbU (regulator of sigma subunit)
VDSGDSPPLERLEGIPDELAVGVGVPGPTVERAGDELVRVLETMPAAFCFLDPHWRLRYVNARAEQLVRRPRAQLLGRCLWETFPALVGTTYETAYRAAVATGEPVSFVAADPLREGAWLEVRAWPGADGLAVYLVDVTDRRRAEETARRATARTALLASVTTELSGALDGASALGRLARLVLPTLGEGCIVTVVDREGRARDVGSWHVDPARREMMQEYAGVRLETLPLSSPVARALGTGTPVTDSIDAVLALMPPGPARDLLITLGCETAVVLPLTAEARIFGVLSLYLDPGRLLSEEDLETVRQVAAQAGRAIERVHRQSEQAKLAEGLQRCLLPDPPTIPHASVVVRYVPAAEAARVGGDWYDAFLQRDGAPVIVIGDVVGHDTAAAAAMGQLRGLLRGIAHYSGAGPAEVLRGLDEAMAQMHDETLATAAVARLQCAGPDGWQLRWANAGHPPPLLVRADGSVTVLGGQLGDLLLGVDSRAQRAEEETTLEPGATVLLYTDGLVERRGSVLDEGMDRLVHHVRELAPRPLEDLCDALLDRMLEGTPRDDVALVAIRLHEVVPEAR